jgi:hypothetical protein
MPSRRGSRLADDSGQGLVEYALILALASLGMVFALVILQDSIGNSMLGSSRQIDAAAAGAPTTLPGDPSGTETGDRGANAGSGADPGDYSDGKSHGHGNGKGNSGSGRGNGGPNGRK